MMFSHVIGSCFEQLQPTRTRGSCYALVLLLYARPLPAAPPPPPGKSVQKGKATAPPSSMARRRRARRRFPLPFLLFLLLSLALPAGAAPRRSPQPQVACSKSCVAENCNSVGIRYGKFCGVGWTGCPGERPCDELDACCKAHDECVEKKGLMSVKCHEKFKSCIKKVKKSGKVGFSSECPYEVAMPTMIQGMDVAILFSQLGSPKYEL